MNVRRARTNTVCTGDTDDGRRQPVRAGRLDGGGEYDDDVQTGRNDARNETDCDGAVVVVALLGFQTLAYVCVYVCARASAMRW